MRLLPFVTVCLIASLALAQQSESRDDLSSTALRAQVGGPSTVGDPVRVSELTVTHDDVDLVVNTGLGSLPLVRKYSSSSTWRAVFIKPAWHGFGDPSPNGLNGTVQWWNSMAAYATVTHNYGNPKTGELPSKHIDVRDTSGDLYNSDNLFDLDGAVLPVTKGNARLVRSMSNGVPTDEWLQLVKPGVGRTEFEYVYTEPLTSWSDRKYYRLKAIYPESYSTSDPESRGQPQCTLSYPSGPTVDHKFHVSNISCGGGVNVSVAWDAGLPDGGTAVVGLSLSQSGVTSETVDFTYGATGLISVLHRPTGEQTAYEYWTSPRRFRVWRGAVDLSCGACWPAPTYSTLLFEKTIAGADITRCGGYQGSPTVSSEATLSGSVAYTPYSGNPCLDVVNTVAHATPSGETLTETFTTSRTGGYTRSLSRSCQAPGGACLSLLTCGAEWNTNQTLPEPTDTWSRDFRNSYTATTAHAACYPDPGCTEADLKDTEVTARVAGATDNAGANALSSTAMTWQYSERDTHEQLPQLMQVPSVLKAGMNADTHWSFDGVSNRPVSVIRHGWTKDASGSLVERYVGTFFFIRHACQGLQDDDAFGRIVEVHGPCEVSGPTATDCSAPPVDEYWPLTQFSFHQGQQGNRVQTKRVATNWAGGVCGTGSGVKWLETTFNSYDARGNVLSETDASGVTTTRTYSGGRLMEETVGGATTQYFYHPSQGGQVSAKRLPSGVWEKYCYRSGAAADCLSGGTLGTVMVWKGRVAWNQTTEPSGSFTFIERNDLTYVQGTGALAGGGALAWEWMTAASSPVEGVLLNYGFDALGRTVRTTTAPTPWFGANYSTQKVFDESDNVLGESAPFNAAAALCGGQGGNSQYTPYLGPVDPKCTGFRYDRLNRVDKVVSATTAGGSPVVTEFSYDAQGNVASVRQTPGGDLVYYEHDDFGNVVAISGQWQTYNTTFQEYDARGNLRKKRSPSGILLDYRYDGASRPLDARVPATSTTLWAIGYDDSASQWANCLSPTAAHTIGRAQWKDDSFGRTWYEYDATLGLVTAQRRVRAGGTSCSSSGNESSDATPDSKFFYLPDGRLRSMKYPHGRWLGYDYRGAGEQDRVLRVQTSLSADGSGNLNSPTTLVNNVVYGVGGAIIKYELGTSPVVTTEWIRGATSGFNNPCNVARPTWTDGTQRLWSLWVTRPAAGGGTETVTRRFYSWNTDQLVADSTCVVGDSNAPLCTTASTPRCR